jgi:hypothetical protein
MQFPGEYVLSRKRGCSTQSVPVHSIVKHTNCRNGGTVCYILSNLSRCVIHVSDATAGERKEYLVTGSKQAGKAKRQRVSKTIDLRGARWIDNRAAVCAI